MYNDYINKQTGVILMKNTKAAQVLKFLSENSEGLKFGDLQRFVVEKIAGLNYDLKQPEPVWNYSKQCTVMRERRVHRGYWCNYLPGLLAKYADKNYDSGRYTINDAGRVYVETGKTCVQQGGTNANRRVYY
jgi:hypothetical protein